MSVKRAFAGLLSAEEYKPRPRNALSGRFLVPPFSVLNAREGEWQQRKRAWLSLGIRSEVGRGENLLKFSDSVLAAQQGKEWGKEGQAGKLPGRKATAIPGGGGTGKNSAWLFKSAEDGYLTNDEMDESQLTGTSIFDPVLCEIAYRWFCPVGGHVLDPFCGGSVRGIVAGELGLNYTGIDLRQEQIDANNKQAEQIGTQPVPRWLAGDSRNIASLTAGEGNGYDFIFSCPPYGHLEVYSDDKRDISNMSPEDFGAAYNEIILESCKLLKPGRFACFVVGDARTKEGDYTCIPEQTIAAFMEAGLWLYGRAILVTSVGSLPMRINRQFLAGRKLGNTHQYMFVFSKGDPKKFLPTWSGTLLDKEIGK